MYYGILIYCYLLAHFSFTLTLLEQCFFCFYFSFLHFLKQNYSISSFSKAYAKAAIKSYSTKYVCFQTLITFTKLCSLLATFFKSIYEKVHS